MCRPDADDLPHQTWECDRCGAVGEIPSAPVAQSLKSAARASGFAPKLSVVEITGTCAHCQRAA